MAAQTGIVFDIGGTSFRAGIFDFRSGLQKATVIRQPTPSFLSCPNVPTAELQHRLIGKILEAVRSFDSKKPGWISIPIAGPVSSDGLVRQAPPLWGAAVRPLPLRKIVEKGTGKPCLVVNDLSAAAARYGHMPRYRKFRRICVITVSSGLGNKVYDTQRQELLLGKSGYGGEMGHVRVDFSGDAPLCDCGEKGHLSAIASGRGAERFARRLAGLRPGLFRRSPIFRWTQKRPARITARHLDRAAKRADPFLKEVLNTVTHPLAASMALMAVALGLEKFILMGGFAQRIGRPYLNALLANLKEIGIYGRSAEGIGRLVDLAIPDDDHGLVGAGLLAKSAFMRSGAAS